MKFSKSMHAEGWADHFDDAPAAPVRARNNPTLKRGFKAGAKPVSAHTPLHLDVSPRTPIPAAPAATPVYTQAAAPAGRPAAASAPVASAATRSSSVPWVVGAGLGVLLIGGTVVMSRNTAPTEPSMPVVVGQVTPSPEEAQLQTAPPSAGTETPVPETLPAVDEAPAVKAADEPPAVKPAPAETRTAKAPAVSAPPVVAAAPAPRVEAPAPVVRTLTPPPEVLAQASPPPVLPVPREAPQATAPVSVPAVPSAALPAETASAPAMPPLAAAPVAPPVVAQQAPAPAPAAPDPADTGITLQVRQALAADMTLAAVPIAVSTEHGVVKLEGQAPDAQARDRATVVAANTSGVKGVDNRLTLPPVASLDRSTVSNGG